MVARPGQSNTRRWGDDAGQKPCDKQHCALVRLFSVEVSDRASAMICKFTHVKSRASSFKTLINLSDHGPLGIYGLLLRSIGIDPRLMRQRRVNFQLQKSEAHYQR
jgi:hypothetical protein